MFVQFTSDKSIYSMAIIAIDRASIHSIIFSAISKSIKDLSSQRV